MSKQYFDVDHKGRIYRCYLDERGEVWYLDETGNPTSMIYHRKVTSIEEAKQTAIDMLYGHGK